MTNSLSTRMVFLTGLSGSGKSAVARRLSQQLKCRLIDVDERIEQSAGGSINELFASEGEAGFRKIESEVIGNIIETHKGQSGTQVIVALGGGALISRINLERIMKAGTLIHLAVRCDVAATRLSSHKDRPLTLDDRGENLPEHALSARLQELLETRLPGYAQAALTIDTSEKTVAQVCADIITFLQE